MGYIVEINFHLYGHIREVYKNWQQTLYTVADPLIINNGQRKRKQKPFLYRNTVRVRLKIYGVVKLLFRSLLCVPIILLF